MASCTRKTDDECQAKCYPILAQNLPSENQSHIKCQPVPEQVDSKPCGSEIKGFPVCGESGCCKSCYDVDTGHQRQCECPHCQKKRQEACEQQCFQHTEGNQFLDLKKKSYDPEVQAIRDRMASSQYVRESLKWCPDDEWLTCVDRRFRQSKQGLLGKAVVHYGAAQDCDFPKEMRHGVTYEYRNEAAKLVNPPIKPWPEQLETELKESYYLSNRMAPIGHSHDQTLNLPAKIIPDETTFGKPTDKDISAAILVNPPKSKDCVEAEYNCCRQLYRKTHGEFKPGEQVCRNYDEPFKRTNTYGIPTPCDPAGRYTKKLMTSWRSCEPDLPYVNKSYADHVDMRCPKLGLPQDRQCIGRMKGDCFTYGKTSETEKERPIREIIFNRCPNPGAQRAEKIMQNLKDWLEKVRKAFKSPVGPELESFYEHLVSRDKDCNGTVDWNTFLEILKYEKIPCLANKDEFMEALILVQIYHPLPCDRINFYGLMDLIKGHEDPMFTFKTTTLKPWYIPHTNGCIHFRTTYSDFAAPWCLRETCLSRLKDLSPCGMTSVRSDKVPSKIRKARDTTNYGDDGDAYSLIWPSIYTLNGITCRDAFRELTSEQMKKLLCDAAVSISHDEFDKVWKKAQEIDPNGKDKVCFQTFREALHIHRDEQNKMFAYSEEVQISDCPHGQNPGACANCRILNLHRPIQTKCSTGI